MTKGAKTDLQFGVGRFCPELAQLVGLLADVCVAPLELRLELGHHGLWGGSLLDRVDGFELDFWSNVGKYVYNSVSNLVKFQDILIQMRQT